MDIRIGILHSAREVVVELADDASAEDLKAQIDAAVGAGEGLVWLTDKKGNQSGFPAAKIAYVEIGSADDQRIGFS